MLPQVRERFDALIASGQLPLPLLPEVASQVLSLVDRPDCDARKLSELIKRDPAMTAHVIQVANSPMYAASTKIVSLQQAIGRLGFATIVQIAMVAASKARVFAVAGFEAEVKVAFRHALATALFAQEIARLRKSTVDSAFLAGLFHDFGQPVLLQALVDLHRAAHVPPDKDDVLAAVDAAHAAVGGMLVESWQLPKAVADAVRTHHAPAAELAHLVALADSFAHGVPSQELAAPLNMYPEDTEAIAKRSADIMATVEAIA